MGIISKLFGKKETQPIEQVEDKSLDAKTDKKSLDAMAFFGANFPTGYVDSWNKTPKPDKANLVKEYRGFISSCINLNVNKISRVGLGLYRKSANTKKSLDWKTKRVDFKKRNHVCKSARVSDTDLVEEIVNHPFNKILTRPNSYQDWITFFRKSEVKRWVYGVSYWLVVKNKMGLPQQLHLLHSPQVKKVMNKDFDCPDHYTYRGNDYDLNDIIELQWGDDPANQWLSRSPLENIWQELSLENRLISTESAILDNETIPRAIYSVKEDSTIDSPEKLEREINARYRRSGAGGVMVIEGGDKLDVLSVNPRDLASLKVRDSVRLSISHQLGIPYGIWNDGAGSQYGVQETLLEQWIDQAIRPALEINQSGLNQLIQIWDDSGDLFVSFDDCSPRNREFEAAQDNNDIKFGIRTQNEVRATRGLPPIAGADTLANPIGTAAQPTPPPEESKHLCSCGEIKKKSKQRGHNKPIPDSTKLTTVLKSFFKKQRQFCLDRLPTGKSFTKGLPSKFILSEKWDRELFTDSQPLIELAFRENYKRESGDLVARTGLSPDIFNVTNPHLKQKVKDLTLTFCAETNATTSKKLNDALDELRGSLEEGFTEGERMSQLTQRVNDIFDNADNERAYLIAQTESSRAANEATRESGKDAKEAGVNVQGLGLLPASDACDLCLSLADDVIDLDGSFYHDDTAPEEYQDRLVPVHPACKCAVQIVLGEGE